MDYIEHPFQPVFDQRSRVLILGTIPSPQSRRHGFYYSHPQNAFWRVLASLFGEPVPQSIEEKTVFLLKHRIAVWDVLHACKIRGASDSHIRFPVANDFSDLLANAPIQQIFTTGRKATELYQKLCEEKTQRPAMYLPSTSPANRRWYPYEKLLEAYQILLLWVQK